MSLDGIAVDVLNRLLKTGNENVIKEILLQKFKEDIENAKPTMEQLSKHEDGAASSRSSVSEWSSLNGFETQSMARSGHVLTTPTLEIINDRINQMSLLNNSGPSESLVNKLEIMETLLKNLNDRQDRMEQIMTNFQTGISMEPIMNKLIEFEDLLEKGTNRLERMEKKIENTASQNHDESESLLANINVIKKKINRMESSLKASQSRKSVEPTSKMNDGGVILCAGGEDFTYNPSHNAQVYDSINNKWFKVGQMIEARSFAGLVGAEGKLYAIGGTDGRKTLSSAEVFNPSTGVWRRIARMKGPVEAFGAVYTEGKIYAIGGLDDSSSSVNKVEIYDINRNLWTQLASMNVKRGGVGCALLGGLLYAVGGSDGNVVLNSCECYDPLFNSWQRIASMSQERTGMGVCELDGFLYAVGGLAGDYCTVLDCVERFDNKSNKWTRVANLNTPRRRPAVAVMDGCIYAIGGRNDMGTLKSVEMYSPIKNRWFPVANLNEEYFAAGAAWTGCSLNVVLDGYRKHC